MRVIPDDAFAAITIRSEAEGEPYEGKVAVGEVIRRRIRQRFYSDGTVIGTCFLRMQFSVWNDDKQDNARAIKMLNSDDADPYFLDCLAAWKESSGSVLVPNCVQYYRANGPGAVLPAWVGDFDFVRTIGHHDFLKRKAGP